jgi:hypothetical protein
MNDNSTKSNPRKLTKGDLPFTVENVPAVQQMKTRRRLGGILIAIALIPLIYGAYLIIFGPDHLTVNRFSGPTFWQAVQLNPGAIASLGFVGVAGGRLIRQSAIKKVTTYIDEHFVLVNKFGKTTKKYRLVGSPTKEGMLVLRYRKIAASQNQSEK